MIPNIFLVIIILNSLNIINLCFLTHKNYSRSERGKLKKQSHELEELNFIFKAIKTFFIGSKLIVSFAELQHRETKTDSLSNLLFSFRFQQNINHMLLKAVCVRHAVTLLLRVLCWKSFSVKDFILKELRRVFLSGNFSSCTNASSAADTTVISN